jgi:hypothetical protein
VQQKEWIGLKSEKRPLMGMILISISGRFSRKSKNIIDMKL